jgi:hypothetical protein
LSYICVREPDTRQVLATDPQQPQQTQKEQSDRDERNQITNDVSTVPERRRKRGIAVSVEPAEEYRIRDSNVEDWKKHRRQVREEYRVHGCRYNALQRLIS